MKKSTRSKKTSHPNTENTQSARSLVSAGHSEWPFGLSPSGDKYYDMMALSIMRDCMDESKRMMSITQWCLHAGVHPQDLDNYKEKNETFRKAYNVALSAIGERRENEIRNGAPTALAYVLPQFNKSWKAERDDRANLKANLEGKSGTELHVHIEPTPSTDIVKPRIVETTKGNIDESY